MEAIFNVLKGPFSKEFKRSFNTRHPELADRLSTRHLKETQTFIDGYMACFACMVEAPFNETEVKTLVLSEGLRYIETKM